MIRTWCPTGRIMDCSTGIGSGRTQRRLFMACPKQIQIPRTTPAAVAVAATCVRAPGICRYASARTASASPPTKRWLCASPRLLTPHRSLPLPSHGSAAAAVYVTRTPLPVRVSSRRHHRSSILTSTWIRSLTVGSFSETDRSKIDAAACEAQTSVSLQALMRTGRGEYLHRTFHETIVEEHAATELVLMQVASFLRRELPIRMAHRVADLEGIPLLRDLASVQQVKEAYIQSCLDIIHFASSIIDSPKAEEDFSKVIETIYERHGSVLVQMARSAYEFRQAVRQEKGATDIELEAETHAFLDRFYLCRIGIRVLIGQYLALRQPPVENYIGIICSHTSPYEIVKRAIDDAAFMCTRKYGDAPEVIITGRLDLTFPYVPTHLHYIMLELIKNSMRATVEWHGIDGDFPPIKVVIADGNDNEDVVIKVSDEGGGIPRSNMKKIWSYLFTTADPSIQEGMIGVTTAAAATTATSQHLDHGTDSPLAGLGYGLPISRSYCRYFGGDLSIMSMEGYGTDAFVYLTRLGNTREPLPI